MRQINLGTAPKLMYEMCNEACLAKYRLIQANSQFMLNIRKLFQSGSIQCCGKKCVWVSEGNFFSRLWVLINHVEKYTLKTSAKTRQKMVTILNLYLYDMTLFKFGVPPDLLTYLKTNNDKTFSPKKDIKYC